MSMSPKTRSILSWSLQIIFGLLFVIASLPKLTGTPGVLEMFENWGYPGRFAHVVGALEFAGGVGLLIPRVARYAAAGLLVVMVGAFFTHLFAAEYMRFINVGVFSMALLGVRQLRRSMTEIEQPEE